MDAETTIYKEEVLQSLLSVLLRFPKKEAKIVSKKDYERGWQSAYRLVLQQAMNQLPHGGFDRAGLVLERNQAVATLREVCREHGDLDWSDDLHLADVIEKHLGRHLDGQREAVLAEVVKLRDDLDEVAEGATDLLREPNRLVGAKARLLMENLRLSKQVADLEAARDEAKAPVDPVETAEVCRKLLAFDGLLAAHYDVVSILDAVKDTQSYLGERIRLAMKTSATAVETAAEATERTYDRCVPQTVQIEVPIGPPLADEGGCPDQVELVRCNCRQRKAIWRLFVGLSLSKAQTANGEPVENQEEAVLWLLEQVARAMQKRDDAGR